MDSDWDRESNTAPASCNHKSTCLPACIKMIGKGMKGCCAKLGNLHFHPWTQQSLAAALRPKRFCFLRTFEGCSILSRGNRKLRQCFTFAKLYRTPCVSLAVHAAQHWQEKLWCVISSNNLFQASAPLSHFILWQPHLNMYVIVCIYMLL